MNKGRKDLFLKKDSIAFFGALLCCFLWGSGYPCIKQAFHYLNIKSDDIGGILLFMGIRFALAGIIVLVYGVCFGHPFLLSGAKQWKHVFVLQIFQPVLIHVFFYIGLAHTKGVTSSVMSGLGTLCTVLMSIFLFRLEKLTRMKLVGCILGFVGILVYNFNDMNIEFTFMGEGMLLLFAVASGIGYNLIKIFVQKEDVITFSGWQYFIGGILTIIAGLFMGGKIEFWSTGAILMMVYLVLASAVSFTLWSDLIRVHEVSKISVYRFMEPFIGVVISIIMLHEYIQFIQTLIALACVCTGMYVVNRKENRK